MPTAEPSLCYIKTLWTFPYILSESPWNFGVFLYGIRKLDEAEKSLRNAVEISQSNALAHTYLAKVLAQKGNNIEAQAEERIAEELEQKDPRSRTYQRPTRGSEQSVEDEIAALRLALETNRMDLPALSRLVLLLIRTNQYEGAISLLQSRMEVIQNKPYFIG